MCDLTDLFGYRSGSTRDSYRYTTPEAYRSEFEDPLPFSRTEEVIPSLPIGGVGAVSARPRACAGGPDAP